MHHVDKNKAAAEDRLETPTHVVARSGRVVTYWPVDESEPLTKRYDSEHAVAIIFGRLKRDKQGRYLHHLLKAIKIEELRRAKPVRIVAAKPAPVSETPAT